MRKISEVVPAAPQGVFLGHVLIVEDDESCREFVATLLEKRASRLSFAGDGRKAVELALRHRPDLILLDLTLPGFNGVEVCGRLRGDARTKDIPILIMTAMSDSSGVVKAAAPRFGADDFLYKPFTAEDLTTRLAHLTRRQLAPGEDVSRGAADVVVGAVSIGVDSRAVRVAGKDLPGLSAKEFELLLYLARHSPRIVHWEELEREVWRLPRPLRTDGHAPETIRVHVAGLKRKLRRLGPSAADGLITRRGVGLQLLPR